MRYLSVRPISLFGNSHLITSPKLFVFPFTFDFNQRRRNAHVQLCGLSDEGGIRPTSFHTGVNKTRGRFFVDVDHWGEICCGVYAPNDVILKMFMGYFINKRV